MNRREFIGLVGGGLAMAHAAGVSAKSAPRAALPTRKLGGTGREVSIFGLGGEGVLRTRGRQREAAQVIEQALVEGVTYFDTAPAYEESRDYLGSALGDRRKDVFLASKTHARDADGTKRLVADTLTRLRTDTLDLVQLHDLREMEELDRIFGPAGALSALLDLRRQGVVRHIGITGHHDPAVLAEALRRHTFDTLLTVVNPAEPHGPSFMRDVIPEARARGMGVIGMKVLARGKVFHLPATDNAPKALRYAWSCDVDTAIVGCWTPEEVSENARAARGFSPLPEEEKATVERDAKEVARLINPWKQA